MKVHEYIGGLGQWVSLGVSLTGLIVMLSSKGAIGDDITTSGAIVLTVATKIRYYGPHLLAFLRRKRLKVSEPETKTQGE